MTDEKCSDRHETLYHYTTMGGFRGIMKTQALWATHYQHLNDSSELARFTPVLTDILVPTVKKVIKQRRDEKRVRQGIEKAGSRHKFALREAGFLSEALFDAAFTQTGLNTVPMFEPFIISFCAHLKDDEYTRDHGLLSMWRNYAAGGGVAIVMDTAALEDCLRQEVNEYGYSSLSIGDVVYEGDFEAFNFEFGGLIEDIKEKAYQHFRSGGASFEDFLASYISSVASFKHRAFKEECEVRIISMPWNKRTDGHERRKDKKTKLELSRIGHNGDIRYLELLGGQASPRLPIRKIIIGPHHDQQGRFEEIRKATKHLPNVDVTCSETPLIER